MHPVIKPFARRHSRHWALRLFATTGLITGMLQCGDVQANPSTFTFPAPNPGWVVALNNGQPVTDVEGDTPGARDIVGDAANPMLYIASDATHLYFRLRIDSDPLQNATNFGPFGWGCLINTDSNQQTFEFSTIVDGVNNPDTIFFYKNTVTTTSNDPADAPDTPAISSVQSPLTAAVGHARVVSAPSMFGGDGDFFLQWAIDLAPMIAAGFNPANPASYYCGSANSNTLGADCSGGAICGGLDTEFSDPITCGTLGCAICGDGQKGASEGCDDGNQTSGDGCNSVCLVELGQPCAGVSTACASGFCDPAGDICACDTNGDCLAGQFCNTTSNPNLCVMPGCGNNVLEAGEGCDDGNTTPGDGCNAVCLNELGQTCVINTVCASGFCDPDGNACACNQTADCPVPNLCNVVAAPNACVAPGCGNNVIEVGEGCDDGNTMAGDGCDAICLLERGQPCAGNNNSCASGFCDPSAGFCACDDDGDCPNGQSCNLLLNPNQCVPAGCGNGTIDAGEGCDDGNLNNGDGCNAQCLKELGRPCTSGTVCASGFCDVMICACDAEIDCPGIQLCNVQANPNICVNPGCGNFVVEVNEGCDDGNTTSGDGCTDICLLELGEACTISSVCASNSCDPVDSTCVCDENADCPGTAPVCKLSTDPNLCVVAGCGNGVIEAGEACDDDNKDNGDGCNSVCLLEIGESCPSGSTTCASGFCDLVGTLCACDEIADCPMGKLCNFLADPNVCVDPGCGNGVVETGEGCDDGNTNSSDGCTNACLREIGESCTLSNTCASGFCDSTDNTCACDQSADCSGVLICNTVASPNICVNPGCGNFVVESTEGCDDGNTTAGDGCDIACMIELGNACTTSTSCATGLCDGNVCVCDQDADCSAGEICNTNADPNVCVVAGCGNGVVEANEGCDDGNTLPGDGCDVSCAKELGQTCTDNSECGSGLCDNTANQCVCNKNSDCPLGEQCNATIIPHACIIPPIGCSADTDCSGGLVCDELSTNCVECTADSECKEGVCDEVSSTCVGCTSDAECRDGTTCTAETHQCTTKTVLIDGGGLFCTVSSTSTSNDHWPLGLFGLLGLSTLRRRRR